MTDVRTRVAAFARDAFEDLRLMDALIAVKRGVPGATLPELKQRRVPQRELTFEEPAPVGRSDVAVDGYRACPDLEDRARTAELLWPERIGVRPSEEFQLHPEQSTDAIVVHRPEASDLNAGGRA